MSPRASPRASGIVEGVPWNIVVPRVIGDIVAIFVAFAVNTSIYALVIRGGVHDRSMPDPLRYLGLATLFVLIAIPVFWRLRLYERRASVLNLWELDRSVKAVIIASAFFLATLFVLKLEGFSRVVVVSSMGGALVLVTGVRRFMATWFRSRRAERAGGRRVLIVGCGDMGRLLMKKIVDAPHLHREVAGFVDERLPIGTAVRCVTDQATNRVVERSVVGRGDELFDLVRYMGIDEVIADGSVISSDALDTLFKQCRAIGVRVGVVPHYGGFRADELQLEDLSAVPVLRPRVSPRRQLYETSKRVFDVVAAGLLAVISSPVFAIVWALARLQSSGSVFFRQTRVGLHGAPFELVKFRTMREDANAYATSPTSHFDPRITRFGRILRVTGLDEMPQLINVLRGEMSLVGPRPEMPFLVERYTELERQRLNVKPGLTGLWQLSPDRHGQIHESIEYDFYYIHHRSFLLDILILVETVFTTFEIAFRWVTRRWREPAERPQAAPSDRSRLTEVPPPAEPQTPRAASMDDGH